MSSWQLMSDNQQWPAGDESARIVPSRLEDMNNTIIDDDSSSEKVQNQVRYLRVIRSASATSGDPYEKLRNLLARFESLENLWRICWPSCARTWCSTFTFNHLTESKLAGDTRNGRRPLPIQMESIERTWFSSREWGCVGTRPNGTRLFEIPLTALSNLRLETKVKQEWNAIMLYDAVKISMIQVALSESLVHAAAAATALFLCSSRTFIWNARNSSARISTLELWMAIKFSCKQSRQRWDSCVSQKWV